MWLVYAISAALIWGLDYSLGERIFRDRISPVTLLLFQMMVGLILFFTFAMRGPLKADLNILTTHRATLFWVFLATITFNLGNYLIFASIQHKNATTAGLIELCYPIFTVFFSWLLFGENHLTPSIMIGSTLIFAGIFVIAFYN